MVTVKLYDGSLREYPDGSRLWDIARELGGDLGRQALAAQVEGRVVDLERLLTDALAPRAGAVAGQAEAIELRFLTPLDREALDVLRHSTAHVMARAVMRVFDGVKLAFGPTIENGFYYDFDLPHAISEEDFPRIEEEMRAIIQEAEPFQRFELPTQEARAFCGDLGQMLKVEHIDEDLKQFPQGRHRRQVRFSI
jgi:threonyl-tRNA synthetase